MNKQSVRALLAFTLFFSLSSTLHGASDPISFQGGYTRAVMKEGRESIILSEGAVVSSGSITLEAQTIEIIGSGARYISGSDSVRITDTENNLTILCSSISFDRETEQLLADGWVEIQDLENEVMASGAFLSYGRLEGIMRLQVAAKLLHHTDSGPMVCRAHSIEYDRNAMRLLLVGNVSITWKTDQYEASSAMVNLETEEIIMEGGIKGTVHG